MSSKQSLILAMDTATSCSSISLTRGVGAEGELVAELTLNSKVTHSRRLLSGIEWLLTENHISFDEIDALAVGLGPGSFTGLRIAMATVKGLASAMEKPLLGVSTLDALAFTCSGERPLCVLIDARKKEIYRRWYTPDIRGRYNANGCIEALQPAALLAEINHPVLMVGDGVLGYGGFLSKHLEGLLMFAPHPLHYPSAAAVGFLGCEELQAGNIMEIESATPLYIRASDAELSLINKEQQDRAKK